MTTTLRPKVAPTDADIIKATSDLARIGEDGRYAYATGYLGSLIGAVAEAHNRCRTADCWTCWHIRRGLALVAALDTTSGDAR